MDPNYSSNCRQPGFYNIPDRGEQQESRQHLPLPLPHQQPQHLPHYPPHHQLPFNPALIPTPTTYAVAHAENLRARDNFAIEHAGSSMLRSVYGVSGPGPAGSNVLAQQGNPGIHSFPHRDQDPTPSQGPRPTSGTTNLSFTPAVVSQATLPGLTVRSGPVQGHSEQNIAAPTSSHNNKSATPVSTSHKSPQPPITNDSTASKTTGQLQVQSSPINSNDGQQLQSNSSYQQPSQIGSNAHLPLRSGSSDNQPNRFLPPKKLTKKNAITEPLLTTELPGYLEFKYTSGEGKENIAGVVAKETIEKGAEFGPFEGSLLDEEIGAPKETTWEVCISGKVLFYVNGHKKEEFNWMSRVRCAHSEDQQNVEVFQYYGQIYYRTTKAIDPGSELRIFYSQEYAERIGFKTKLSELKYNEEKDSFQCSECDSQFATAKLFIRHLKLEHRTDGINNMQPVVTWRRKGRKVTEKDTSCQEGRPHQCDNCDKAYKTKSALNRHDRIIHQGLILTEFECKFCSRKFARKKNCVKHEKTHNRKGQKRKADTMRQLRRKRKESEPEDDLDADSQETSEEKGPDHKEKPRKRGRKAVKVQSDKEQPKGPKDMLGKKADYYIQERPFKCRFCPKTYTLKHMAYEHEKLVHEGTGRFKCTICERAFMSEVSFLSHIRTHDANRIYRCKLCPRTFASESALNNHQGEHTGLKPFKCEICGRGFRVRRAVSAHKRRMHQNREPRFFCSFCQKGFHEMSALRKHEQRHRGIRPYVCLTCGWGFTEKCALVAHTKRKHSEEKPFTCEECGKSFAVNQNYSYHILRHKQRAKECLPGYNVSLPEMQQLPPT